MENLSGQKFNRLTIVSFEKRRGSHYLWRCKCKCGNETISDGYAVKTGRTKSCGCLTSESLKARVSTHGMSNTRIYTIWHNMIRRCYDVKNTRFHCYGAKGIKVCERWHKFENFYEDLKDEYDETKTLDRFPNKNGDYEPNNVRWATNLEQQRNKNNNILYEINGKSLTIMQWAEFKNITYDTIRGRIRRGWDYRDAILTPPIKKTISAYAD